jgi:hypothetical protein
MPKYITATIIAGKIPLNIEVWLYVFLKRRANKYSTAKSAGEIIPLENKFTKTKLTAVKYTTLSSLNSNSLGNISFSANIPAVVASSREVECISGKTKRQYLKT